MLLGGVRTRDDLGQFLGNRSLSCTVVAEGEALDHLFRISGCGSIAVLLAPCSEA